MLTDSGGAFILLCIWSARPLPSLRDFGDDSVLFTFSNKPEEAIAAGIAMFAARQLLGQAVQYV